MAFRVSFADVSISDIHSPTKVYTFCQYGAFFTKMRDYVAIVHLSASLGVARLKVSRVNVTDELQFQIVNSQHLQTAIVGADL